MESFEKEADLKEWATEYGHIFDPIVKNHLKCLNRESLKSEIESFIHGDTLMSWARKNDLEKDESVWNKLFELEVKEVNIIFIN